MIDFAKCVIVPLERCAGVGGVERFYASIYGYSLRDLLEDPNPVLGGLGKRYSGYTPMLERAWDNSRVKAKGPRVWKQKEIDEYVPPRRGGEPVRLIKNIT